MGQLGWLQLVAANLAAGLLLDFLAPDVKPPFSIERDVFGSSLLQPMLSLASNMQVQVCPKSFKGPP